MHLLDSNSKISVLHSTEWSEIKQDLQRLQMKDEKTRYFIRIGKAIGISMKYSLLHHKP